MFVFSDVANNRFYTNNEYINELKKVHITTIDRALRVHKFFNPMVLLDQTQLYEDKNGLLTTTKPSYLPDEAYYRIPFTESLSYAQIAHQCLKTLDFDGKIALVNELEELWVFDCTNSNGVKTIKFSAHDDSVMTIKLNYHDESYEYDLSDAGRLTIDGYEIQPYDVSAPYRIAGWVYQ